MRSDPRSPAGRRLRGVALAATAVAALAAISCGRESQRPAAGTQPAGSVAAPPPADTQGLYRRRLVFVGSGTDSLVAVVLHVSARAVPGPQLAHGLFGWIGTSIGWDPFVSYEWRGSPMRQPGRLIPHGELRLMVGDDGGIQAVAYDSASTHVRVTAGSVLAEWTRLDALSLRLRQARATIGGRHYTGALLITSDNRDAHGEADVHGGDIEGLVTDGRSWTVLAQGRDMAPLALLVRLGRGTPDTTFTPLAIDAVWGAAPARVVVDWRLLGADSAAVGRLTPLGTAWRGVSAQPGFEAFEGVHGVLETRGRRRRVLGVLEHGRAGS